MAVKFEHFLSKFPKVELPVILSEDTHHDFSQENDPLPDAMILEYISRYEAVEVDEFTEYIPCFKLPLSNKDYFAIVYWRAALMTYDYFLVTYTKKGKMLDKKAIAGTKVIDNAVRRTVAIVKEDLSIHIAEGIEDIEAGYDAETTKVRRFEIMDTGMIEQDY